MPYRVNCDICRGARVIRLAVHRPVAVPSFNEKYETTIDLDEATRTYPCPKCADTVATDRVAIIQANIAFDSRMMLDPEAVKHTRDIAAHRLVDNLLQSDNYIDIKRGPDHPHHLTGSYVATLGVVSKANVATMEERIAVRQDHVAAQVIEATIAEVMNWGSEYTGGEGPITKSRTCDFLRECFTRIMRERKGEKP